jgi:NO-binding membrane sensor protein with MHYT domain
VAFAVCVVAGFGTVWLAGKFNTADIVSSILIVLVTALSTYKGLWKPTGIAGKVETATSPSQEVGSTHAG